MEEARAERKHILMKEILVYHRRPLIAGMILVFFYNVIDYTILSYMPSHLSAVLGYGTTKGLLFILIVMFIMIPIVITMGCAGDRIGRKQIVQIGLVGLIVFSIPAFWLIDSGSNTAVFFGLMILVVFLASFEGTMPAYYMILSCVIGTVVLSIFVKVTTGNPLRGSPHAVSTKNEIEDVLEEHESSLWWREEKKAIEKRIRKNKVKS